MMNVPNQFQARAQGQLPLQNLERARAQIDQAILTSSFDRGSDPKRGGTPMFVGVPYTLISGGSPDLKPEQSESWSGE